VINLKYQPWIIKRSANAKDRPWLIINIQEPHILLHEGWVCEKQIGKSTKKQKRKSSASSLKSAKRSFGTNNHHNTGEQRKRNQEDHLHMIGKDLWYFCCWRCFTDWNSGRSHHLPRDSPGFENSWNSRKHQADQPFNGPWRNWIRHGCEQRTKLLLMSLKKAKTHWCRFQRGNNRPLLTLVLSKN